MDRIAITGSSGYFGRCLIRRLRERYPAAALLGMDLAPVAATTPAAERPHEFHPCDLAEPGVLAPFRQFAPDTVVHLAFAVQPLHDDGRMRRTNLDGARHVFAATADVGARRLCVASSTTAFGAHADNPMPLRDDSPLRPPADFRYAADKAAIETQLLNFAAAQPTIAVSWFRPCVIAGPGMRNFLQRMLFGPLLLALDGRDGPLQVVHEDDAAAAVETILAHDAVGAFNVAPPDWIALSEFAAATDRKLRRIPLWVVRPIVGILWRLHVRGIEYPPALIQYLRDPWVAAPDRLQQELGFRFRYSTRETLRITYEAVVKRRRKRGGR